MSKDVVVKNSSLHGKGVFANRNFKKGEMILRFTGDLYDVHELPSLLNDAAYDKEQDRYIQVSETKFLGPYKDGHDPHYEAVDNWVNHSCQPNCLNMSDGELGLKVVARQPIKAGEEITIDYSTAMILDSWTMECNCQKPSCRKVVTEFRGLPPELQEHYIQENGVPAFFLKHVDRAA